MCRCRVSDLHHFKADPDPAFHFNADPDPHPGDTNLRPLAHRPSRPPFWASTDLRGSILSLISSYILTLMRIRVQLPKTMRIRIRNPWLCDPLWGSIMAKQHQYWRGDRYNCKPYLWLPPESEPELKLLFRDPSGRKTGAGSLFYRQKMQLKNQNLCGNLLAAKA